MDTKVLVVEIAKLEVKPGDLLLVTVPKVPHLEQKNHLMKVLDSVLPPGVKYMIATKEIEFSVVSAAPERVVDA